MDLIIYFDVQRYVPGPHLVGASFVSSLPAPSLQTIFVCSLINREVSVGINCPEFLIRNRGLFLLT